MHLLPQVTERSSTLIFLLQCDSMLRIVTHDAERRATMRPYRTSIDVDKLIQADQHLAEFSEGDLHVGIRRSLLIDESDHAIPFFF